MDLKKATKEWEKKMEEKSAKLAEIQEAVENIDKIILNIRDNKLLEDIHDINNAYGIIAEDQKGNILVYNSKG
jgi:hypothetical protein